MCRGVHTSKVVQSVESAAKITNVVQKSVVFITSVATILRVVCISCQRGRRVQQGVLKVESLAHMC